MIHRAIINREPEEAIPRSSEPKENGSYNGKDSEIIFPLSHNSSAVK